MIEPTVQVIQQGAVRLVQVQVPGPEGPIGPQGAQGPFGYASPETQARINQALLAEANATMAATAAAARASEATAQAAAAAESLANARQAAGLFYSTIFV